MENWSNGVTDIELLTTVNHIALFDNEMINPISLLSLLLQTLH